MKVLNWCILSFLLLARMAGFSVEKPLIIVSIPPQQEFVQRIAQNKVDISVLAGQGSSPHSYEPTPKQMIELSRAKIWFTIGIDFERGLLPKVKSLYPDLKIVDTSAGVKYRFLEEHTHEAEEKKHNEEETKDPHIWLGYDQVKTQLSNILLALKNLNPEDGTFFQKNYDEYIKEIDSTFALLSRKLKPFKGRTVFVYHPAFGYFLDNFGIRQKAFEVRGKEPTQREVVELIKRAREEKVKVIFVQKQFSKTSAITIAKSINGKVVEMDPLAQNWLENIKYMGEVILKGLK